MTDLHLDRRLADLRATVDAWLDELAAEHPLVQAVDRGTSDDTPLGEPRWYVRLRGEAKDVTTIWLTLGQRTLRYETYVIPAPPRRRDEIMDHLLRRNDTVVGAHYSIGLEDAIYLRGELPDTVVVPDELDRVIGTLYTTVERDLPTLIRLAFTP